MPEETRAKTKPRAKPARPDIHKKPQCKANIVWGGYKPAIYESYPDPPVRGRIANTKAGRMFRPDPGQVDKRHKIDYHLDSWILNENYDQVVQAMREEADKAIQELKACITRLDRFIERN